ncbi:MAG: site-2 protease family protein [SAR202 cluster bacterium]|nr:site-2 protease family protein [SAR202 cluster bacterium]
MSGTLNIGRLFGIRLKIHFSWVFIFALVAGTLAISYLPTAYSGWPTPQYWITGIIASALLFACVLAHELSHSLEAMRRGRKVTSITLFFLGGVSQIEEESRSAGEEFWVSVVGPLASLVLAGLFLLLFLNFRGGNSSITALTQYLAIVNLAIGIFNLTPAFPLDGGRVLKAAVWKLSGNEGRAVTISSVVGSGVGFAMIALGVFLLFSSNQYTGIWLVIIGWFIQSSAASVRKQRDSKTALSGRVVRDAMRGDVPTVEPGTSILDLLESRMATELELAYVVVLGDTLQGLITVTDVKRVPIEARRFTWVSQAMTPASKVATLPPDAPLEEGLGILANRRIGQLVVMEDDKPVGLLTRAGVVRVMEVSNILPHESRNSETIDE